MKEFRYDVLTLHIVVIILSTRGEIHVNAYELADELQELDAKLHLIDLFKSAVMLRQQADRIAELEKGEEVAGRFYWESVVDGHVMAVPSEGTPHYNKDDFPLYTTPQTKPLSDEEIHELANEYLRTQNQDGHLVVLGVEDFARAIEERHGIK